MDFFSKLFDTSDFPARWHCGTWTDGHGWLHIASDLLTWASYTAIPITLGVLMLRRKDLFFTPIVWLFTAFILACGTVHLIEAIIFWVPIYRVSGCLKLVTAIVSCATAFTFVRVVPDALELPGLATANEQLRAEIDARKEAETRLTLILQNLSEAVVFVNTTGDFEIWNESASEIIGERPKNVSPDEWSASYTVFDATDGKPMPNETRPLIRALRGEQCRDVEQIVKWPDGDRRVRLVCQSSPVRNDSGKLLGAVLTARDVTEAHEAAVQREQHYRQIERVTELATSVAAAVDGAPIALNSRLLELTGNITDSPSGCLGLIRQDGTSKVTIGKAAAPDRSFEWSTVDLDAPTTGLIEQELLTSDGLCRDMPSSIPLDGQAIKRSVGVPIVSDGVTCGWIMVMNRDTEYADDDVDVLKRTIEIAAPVLLARQELANREQQLAERQREMEHLARASTLGELTTTLAHELNQPMTTIANLAFACSNRLSDSVESEPIRETLTRIKSEALRSGKILRSIRELIQPSNETESEEIAELGALIDRVLELVSADVDRAQVRLNAQHPADHFVRVNPIRIQQLFLNLIRNALDALGGRADGVITISCQSSTDGQIEVRVEDNGPGFEDETAVFNTFYTTKTTGIGIGLKICRSIVEAFGGRITASNRPGGGASIAFALRPAVRRTGGGR